MTIRVLDPTNEMKAAGGQPAERRLRCRARPLGFISNGKEGTKGYFAASRTHVARGDLGVADVVWRTKTNYSAPADAQIVDEIKTGRPLSPASAIEAAAHRAVCMTLSQLNDKASPPSG